MDIKRPGFAKKKMIQRVIYMMSATAVVALAGWRVSQLKPAAPAVAMATIWPDTVKRGPLVRDVRGLGTLVPEDIRWIQAAFESQVSKLHAQSGDEVGPETVLLVLINPQMEADAVDYQWQTKQAEANLADLKVRLQSQTFDQQSSVATAQGDLKQSELTKEKEEQLYQARLEPEINVKLAVAKWEQASSRFQMEKQKLDIMKDSVEAQIESQKVQIEKLRAASLLKKRQVDELTIRARIRGRMQEMTLEVGQRVKPGDVLAKVAPEHRLMARLQIAEIQAKDILIGQRAQIDTRNGIVPGRVTRIDASVVNGTRTVDCKLDGPLPAGAVPDLSVDGTVEIERLLNVLYIGRPVFAQPNSSATLFKIDEDGKGAARVPVKFGRGSVNAIEVVEGLKAGERVILSDMAAQDQFARVRLD
jgi:HlyD family secretion protein